MIWKLFHIVHVASGTRMTRYPMSQRKCLTMRSKQTRPADHALEPFDPATLTPPGWSHTGYDAPYFLYQTGDYRVGFKEMRLLDQDLTPENVALMVRMGLTR